MNRRTRAPDQHPNTLHESYHFYTNSLFIMEKKRIASYPSWPACKSRLSHSLSMLRCLWCIASLTNLILDSSLKSDGRWAENLLNWVFFSLRICFDQSCYWRRRSVNRSLVNMPCLLDSSSTRVYSLVKYISKETGNRVQPCHSPLPGSVPSRPWSSATTGLECLIRDEVISWHFRTPIAWASVQQPR